MDAAKKQSVLFVYYSYTQQTRRVVEAMAEVICDRGCEAALAKIEFTDERYADRFKVFPMKHMYRDLVGMIPSEICGTTGTIDIPDVVTEREYDLVCIGSPTWWLSTNVPIRSFLESDTAARVLNGKPFVVAILCRRYWRHNLNTVRRIAEEKGGIFVDSIHFAYDGGQLRSLLSLVSYLRSGEYRSRYLGVRIPPTNLRQFQLEQARTFANEVVDRLLAAAPKVDMVRNSANFKTQF
jgi:multimeric flavodoxin WrbA